MQEARRIKSRNFAHVFGHELHSGCVDGRVLCFSGRIEFASEGIVQEIMYNFGEQPVFCEMGYYHVRIRPRGVFECVGREGIREAWRVERNKGLIYVVSVYEM